jgi:AraC-like DNA-binding protein
VRDETTLQFKTAADSPLSETGCRRASPPLILMCGARALYLGPAVGMPAHRNAVAVLAVALEQPLRIAHDARDRSLGFERCRTALIEPNRLHLIDNAGAPCAFLYLDSLSRDLQSLRRACKRHSSGVHFDLEGELRLIHALARMEHDAGSWATMAAALPALASRQACDARIEAAVRSVLGNPSAPGGATALARELGLSASRFLHLFSQTTGLPFRRFRLWARMRAALVCALRGAPLTAAAHEAGFSSSAHFSTSFKVMFGMTPSQLIAAKPRLVES